MDKVTLFSLNAPDIKISMQIYFNEKGQLYFDGYDIGEKVKEIFGDSDYEYTYTIEPGEADRFYSIFNLKKGDKQSLLEVIKSQFSSNKAYSLFGDFMRHHDIKFVTFTWI
jgi:hypothetical protein